MVTIEKLLDVVRQQFEDPDSVVLEINTDFKHIESFDSLTGMCIIVAMKDEFDKEVSEEEFRSLRTMNDLFELISKEN